MTGVFGFESGRQALEAIRDFRWEGLLSPGPDGPTADAMRAIARSALDDMDLALLDEPQGED